MLGAVRVFLEVVGLITTAVSVLLFIAACASWFLGIGPLLYRLGLGRWRRKISVLGSSGAFSSLKSDLIDSGIFREKNIDHLTKSNLAKIKSRNLILVDYGSLNASQIKTVLDNKKDTAGMVIYFPDFSPANRVPDDIMKRINNEPHTVLVNFRGRLINDVLVTLLSTSYEKK